MMLHRNLYFRKLLLTFLLLLLLSTLVFANGAKPIEDPSGNGGLIFDANSNVALTEESINFSIMPPKYAAKSRVTVEYKLKNLINQDQSFSMFFVIPSLMYSKEGLPYSVSLNNANITAQTYYKAMELPQNWFPNFPQGLIEPYSKQSYVETIKSQTDIAIRINKRQMTGINIPISIKANDAASLIVEYDCESGFYRYPHYHNTIYSFIYYLTPAKFWNDEPHIKLNVEFPEASRFAFYSNIPMDKLYENRYSTELSSLPDYEWCFTFVDKKGLIYGTNSSQIHTTITTLISIGIFTASLFISKHYKRRIYTILGYLFSVAYFFLFKSNIVDGYFVDYIIMLPISIVLFFLIPIIYHARYTNKTSL